MRVLVTGGAGFIGSHVVEELLASGHQVTVLDRAEARSPAGADTVVGDVTDADAWETAIDGAEAVCHLAARVGLGRDIADVEDYVAANDVGTAVGLAALHRATFAGRLVLASSMVVYGEGRYECRHHGSVTPGPRRVADLEAGRFEPRCPDCDRTLLPSTVDESAPVDPRNVYAATKVHQEHLCSVFGRTQGVPVTRLRYHNVYGPGMPRNTTYSGVAAVFLSALERGEAPLVTEDGRQRRDFVHVRDVARCTVLALTAERPYDGPLNLASGTPRTVGELADALADASGPGAPRPRTTGSYRLGDVRHVVASAERAARVLGFRAEVPFAEGVAELLP